MFSSGHRRRGVTRPMFVNTQIRLCDYRSDGPYDTIALELIFSIDNDGVYSEKFAIFLYYYRFRTNAFYSFSVGSVVPRTAITADYKRTDLLPTHIPP